MSHVDEQNLVEEEEVESSQNSEKVLMILLTVLLLVMLSSGFLVYKFVLAKSVDENLLTRIAPVYETDEFIVNFSGSTKHFIKTQLALELSNKKVIKELNEKKPLLLDTINMILLNQDIEILTAEGRDYLKTQIMDSINEFLDKGRVENVHYLIFLLT